MSKMDNLLFKYSKPKPGPNAGVVLLIFAAAFVLMWLVWG